MEDSITTQLTGLTTQQQLYVTWAALGLKYLSEAYSSIRAGGGLKRIIVSFWFGETIPKVIADDYKHELADAMAKPPTPPN